MLADTNGGSIDEAYQGAVGSSNLRVGNDHTITTPGDLVAASGMNRHRTGLALLRLRTEWGSAARPSPPTPEDIGRLSRTYPIEKDHPNAGKVKILTAATGKKAEAVEFILPLRLAKRERWRWYEHEINLALMTMRTLPILRDALMHYARTQEIDCAPETVAEVLLWWLDPKCTECGGNREEVVAGTGRTNGRVCYACKGTGHARQGDPPAGRKGMKLAGHINACLQAARHELREGSQRLRRTPEGEAARQVKTKSQ